MNKKGFTLVELLAVITILSILALITTPVVINIINQSKHQAKDRQKELIEGAAERWGVNNLKLLPTSNGSEICVCVSTLVDKGYLSKDTTDITSNVAFNGKVKISYDASYNQQNYSYEPVDVCNVTSNDSLNNNLCKVGK